MNRREVLTWSGVAAAATAAGAGWSWWRQQDGGSWPVDPAFWGQRFERPEGGDLLLSAYKGRVLVVNFWATWCPPCIRELPDLDRLQQARAGSGVQVLGLAVDSPTPVRQYLKRHPLSYPVGLAGMEGSEVSRQLGNESGSLPFTAVFDREGRLRHRKLGQTAFDELGRWIDRL